MKQQKDKPIGVLDSGLGGLTVVRELGRLLPSESIVYFGDNANVPYGNRPKEEILKLTFAMLDFLQSKDVKIAAIACNTISTLIEEFRPRYKFPVVSIIETACEYVAAQRLSQVGVFATEFTVKQGHYERLIKKQSPETFVFSQPSQYLAKLVDEGRFNDPAIMVEVQTLLNALLQARPELKHIVLGCTHYPIVQDIFEQAAPGFTFINPAQVQVQALKALLSEQGLLSEARETFLDIYTSGEKPQYEAALKKLDIKRPMAINKHA